MKKMTKRMFLSVITLVLVVVALGTTTFAWFTLSNVSNISDISATVQAGEGLEIGYSLGGETPDTGYKTNLTVTDWQLIMDKIHLEANSGYKSEDDNGFRFGAVNTKDNATFTTMVLDETVGGYTNLKSEAITENELNSYLKFTIHFKSYTSGSVNLNKYGFDETGAAVPFTPGVIFTPAQGDALTELTKDTPYSFNAANAARISIEGNNADSTPVADQAELVVVQKPADNDGLITSNTANNDPQIHGQFSYLTAKNYTLDGALSGVLPSGAEMLTAVADYNLIGASNKKVATLRENESKGYFESNATVRVWLEGWDADMYDAIFKTILNFNLEFVKA